MALNHWNVNALQRHKISSYVKRRNKLQRFLTRWFMEGNFGCVYCLLSYTKRSPYTTAPVVPEPNHT